mmetsp:Transcript_11492/g.39825  ORF Transcript_11492/g.39825 Transcript_11492/m.39825 type:complete len:297 (-) Transcript_11492:21-911(-)
MSSVADRMRTMAWFAGVRRSMTRLSRRVSRPTVTRPSSASFSLRAASASWNGRSGAALETMWILRSCSSHVPCVHPETPAATTTASTSTMDSTKRRPMKATMAFVTPPSPTDAMHCAVKQPCRSTRKASDPFARTAWTRPRQSTGRPASDASNARTCVQDRSVSALDMTISSSPKLSDASAAAAVACSAWSCCCVRSARRSAFLSFAPFSGGTPPPGLAAFFFLSTMASAWSGASTDSAVFSSSSFATAASVSSLATLSVFSCFTRAPCAPIANSSSESDAIDRAATRCGRPRRVG